MSITEKLNRSLGLESEAAPTVEINVDVDEAGAPLDGVDNNGEPIVEADEAELMEAAKEIDEENDDIEELEEAQATLESILSAMYDDYQNGGLAPESVKFATIAVESIGHKYGITATDVGISLESFQSDRLAASTVSMEGVREFLTSVISATTDKVKTLAEKIKKFYIKNVSAAARLKRRAQAIKKKAQGRDNTVTKKAGVGIKLFKELNINGKEPTFADIEAALKKTNLDTIKKFFISDSELDSILGSMLTEEVVSSDEKLEAETLKQIENIFKERPLDTDLNPNINLGKWNQRDGRFLGITALPGSAAIGVFNANGYLIGGKFYDDKVIQASKDKSISTLSVEEIIKVCDMVSDNLDSIINGKLESRDGVRAVKAIEKHGKKIIKTLDRDEVNRKNRKNARKALKEVTRFYTVTENVAQVAVAYNTKLCKDLLSYAARSLKHHSAAKNFQDGDDI